MHGACNETAHCSTQAKDYKNTQTHILISLLPLTHTHTRAYPRGSSRNKSVQQKGAKCINMHSKGMGNCTICCIYTANTIWRVMPPRKSLEDDCAFVPFGILYSLGFNMRRYASQETGTAFMHACKCMCEASTAFLRPHGGRI